MRHLHLHSHLKRLAITLVLTNWTTWLSANWQNTSLEIVCKTWLSNCVKGLAWSWNNFRRLCGNKSMYVRRCQFPQIVDFVLSVSGHVVPRISLRFCVDKMLPFVIPEVTLNGYPEFIKLGITVHMYCIEAFYVPPLSSIFIFCIEQSIFSSWGLSCIMTDPDSTFILVQPLLLYCYVVLAIGWG